MQVIEFCVCFNLDGILLATTGCLLPTALCLDLETKELRQHVGRKGMCIPFSKITLHRIGEKRTQKANRSF